MEGGDSRFFYELCALLPTLLRSPPGSGIPPSRQRAVDGPAPPITPAAISMVLLGASLSMMLCGSLTFVIGMMMMPWVIGLVVFLYFVGIVSSLKSLGMAILCTCSSSLGSRSIPMEVHGASSPKYISFEYEEKQNLRKLCPAREAADALD